MGLQRLRDDYKRHGSSLKDPAFIALAVYRLGHWAFYRDKGPVRWFALKLYGLINFFVANITKVWIAPQTRIGEEFHIVHAEGSLSIHPSAVIGDRCGIMHNVTIGTNMGEGAPVIGDDVFIGVNSVVLGPVKIGDRVRVGACTAVLTNVPSDSIVIGSPAKIYPRLMPFSKAVRKDIAQVQQPDASATSATDSAESAPANALRKTG
jgi:serine O-acetyltransferase